MNPKWKDGNAANPLAAMLDAREWLTTIRKMHRVGRVRWESPDVTIPALDRSIAAIDLVIAQELAREEGE